MASKLAIVLIPGSFTVAAMYYPLQDLLAAAGYDVYVNTLPSASRNAPELPASLSDDARFFGKIIERIADYGRDIIVLGHSYGGMVASESAQGLSKAERLERGRKGGIIRIIFLAAIVLPEGQSVTGDQGKPPASIVETDQFGFMHLANPSFSGARMYDTWPEERATAWARAAPKHSALSFASPLTYAAYKNIPSTYILCKRDGIIPISKQEQYINNIMLATGKGVDVRRLDTNHVPNLTDTEMLANIVLEIETYCVGGSQEAAGRYL